ncbi:MAG: hypothetical protein ACTH7L_09405 [Psychrobacter alimentarius]
MIYVPNKIRYTCLFLSVIIFPTVFNPLAVLISLLIIFLCSYYLSKVISFDYEEQIKILVTVFFIIFFITFFNVLAHVALMLFFIMTIILIFLQEWLSSFLYDYCRSSTGSNQPSLLENISYYAIFIITPISAILAFDRMSFDELRNKNFETLFNIFQQLFNDPSLLKIAIANYTYGMQTFGSMMVSSVWKLGVCVLAYSIFTIIIAVLPD